MALPPYPLPMIAILAAVSVFVTLCGLQCLANTSWLHYAEGTFMPLMILSLTANTCRAGLPGRD